MEFRVLGPVEVEHASRLIDIGRRRERSLLGVLLLEAGTTVSVARLVDLLWDGEPPAAAEAALRTHVSRLRARLDEGGVELARSGDGYLALVEPDAVDALRFRSMLARARALTEPAARARLLRHALALWRGPLLALAASDRLRGRLEVRWAELRLTALEDALEAELECGRHRELVGELNTLCLEHPFRERLAGLLVLALYRCGRQADALRIFGRLDHLLRQKLGLEPGPELRELHRRILAGDTGLLEIRLSSANTPRQLPAAPRVFTGRRAEISRLQELFETASEPNGPGSVAVFAIDGMAGVGKTALALQIAHGVAERFPDGQLFIDLHGYTPGHRSRTAGEALESLLRGLGVPSQQLPPDLEGRAALYRERLAGTRTLIVLDNAAGEAQVSPLIPGEARCLVLITSRRKPRALDDAYTLALEVPPMADAIALFRTVAGPERSAADDPAVAEIVALCGRLPLAVRIAAALMRHRPAWSPDYLAGLLRDERGRTDVLSTTDRDLTAMFGLSYDSLSADQQRLFRHLGLNVGPDMDIHAIAALLNTTPTTAHALLEHLVDHNLLIEPVAGRYRFHDLVRLYALARTEDEPRNEREDALDRVLGHYTHSAGMALARVARRPWLTLAGWLPGPAAAQPDSDAAWAWLRAERANLTAWLEHAVCNDDERMNTLVAAVTNLLGVDGPWSEAVAPLSAAVATAERGGDRSRQADALTALGIMRRQVDDYPGAIRDLKAALALFREMSDRSGEATALSEIGETSSFINDYQSAARDLRAALTLYRQLDDQVGQAGTLFRLADACFLTGDYPGATQYAQAALDLYRRTNDRQGQARALNELGMVCKYTGNHSDATRYQEQALEMFRAMNDRNGEANVLFRLGELRAEADDHPGAMRDLQAAIDLFRGMGNLFGHAGALTLLGATRLATGDLARATRDLETALGIYRDIGNRGSEAWALNHYAAVISATGDVTRATDIYRDALRLARQVGQPDDEAAALNGIGENLLREKDREDGVAHLRRAAEIYRRLGAPAAEQIAARLAELA